MGERMKSFWLSLFIFIVLMCSCKTKEVVREVSNYEQITGDFTSESAAIKQDTTQIKKVEQTEEFTRIIERETITEYDTEKQTPSKVTTKEKIFEQSKESKTDESENRGITEVDNDSIHQTIQTEKQEKVQEEVKEESAISTFAQYLGKWFGIGIVAMLFCWLIYNGIKKNILHL